MALSLFDPTITDDTQDDFVLNRCDGSIGALERYPNLFRSPSRPHTCLRLRIRRVADLLQFEA